jgi:hypothetical protein
MKIMAKDSSATVRSETPHLSAALKRRTQDLINNKSIDTGTRSVLQHGLAVNDSSLADLVRRVERGETIIDDGGFLKIED